MERRNFLRNSVLASTLLSSSGIASAKLFRSDSSQLDTGNPFHYSKSLESARQMPGFLLNFIASKEETGGNYALLEGLARKGGEPSMHWHENEDEAFFLLEGEMVAVVGDKEYHMKPGDFVFLPRRIPHTQRFISDIVHVLLLISPGGFEDYFRLLTQPASSLEIPELPTAPPPPEFMEEFAKINKKYGIHTS